MKTICVITGGGSGMGLAAAKVLGKTHSIIIAGRTVQKLEKAIEELKAEGIEAESFACDVGDREAVKKMAAYAKGKGKVQVVIHAAGMSPHMGDADKIMEANAIGTIYINEAFLEVMEEGSCLINVSSMSAYMFPEKILPTSKYVLSMSDVDLFFKKMMARVNLFPKKVRTGVAYGISKNFVTWYSKASALRFGAKGIRILSVSPGNFETPMGALERKEASKFSDAAAIKRFGQVEEIAFLFASCADEQNSYLTGADILCDGGVIASRMLKAQK